MNQQKKNGAYFEPEVQYVPNPFGETQLRPMEEPRALSFRAFLTQQQVENLSWPINHGNWWDAWAIYRYADRVRFHSTADALTCDGRMHFEIRLEDADFSIYGPGYENVYGGGMMVVEAWANTAIDKENRLWLPGTFDQRCEELAELLEWIASGVQRVDEAAAEEMVLDTIEERLSWWLEEKE